MSETGGIEAGPLYVDVVADTTGFGADLKAKIAAETARTKATIKAELDARRAEAQLAAIERKQRQVALGVTVDDAKAEAQLATIAAKRRVAMVRADADTAPAQAKLDRLASQRRTISIKAAVEDAQAQAKLQQIEAKRRIAEIRAQADTLNAERMLDQAARPRTATIDIDIRGADRVGRTLQGFGTGGLGLLQWPAIAAGISMAAGALAQVTAGLFSVVAAAAPATGVLAAIPGLVGGVIQGVSAVAVGFGGIGDAVKASGAAEKAAAAASTSASAQRAAAAQRIVAAQDRVKQTQAALANAEISGLRQVEQARQGVADAQMQAVRQVANAERQLAQSQRDAVQAQQELTRARQDATRALEDMNARVQSGRLGVEAAQLGVERAGLNRDRVNRDPQASSLDRRQADLDYREAVQRLRDQQREQKRLETDVRNANRAGVEGSERVTRAKQRLNDANRQVRDSEVAVREARLDGAQKIARAEEDLANARRSAAFQVQSAQHQVELAQRDLAEAQANATLQANNQSAANTALAAALDRLSPAGRRFVTFLTGTLAPAWGQVRKAVQEALLPPVQRGLTAMLPLLGTLQTGLVGTAAVLGGAFERLARSYLATPIFRRDLATILGANNRAFSTLGNALTPLTRMLVDLMVASAPLLQRFAQFIATSITLTSNFVSAQRATGGLARFFQTAGDTAAQLWRIIRDLAVGIFNVGKAAYPAGRQLLASFEGAVARFREWTGSMAGQNTLRDYFLRAVPMVEEVGRLLRDIVGVFFRLGNNPALTRVIAQIRTQMLPAVERLGDALNTTFGPALVTLLTHVVELFADLASGPGGGALTTFVQTLDKIVVAFTAIANNPVGRTLLGVAASMAAIGAATALVLGPLIRVGTFMARVGGFAVGFVQVARGAQVAASGITRLGGQIASKLIPAIMWVGRLFLASGPWGWVILGVSALVTGLITAYRTSETFRRIVDTALQAVGRAALWLWRNAIVPAFEAIKVGFAAVGQAASWLWTNAIRPAFSAIGAFIKWWWTNVTQPILSSLVSFIRTVIFPTVSWLLTNVFRPIFSAIGTVVSVWWNRVVKPVFTALKAFFERVVAPVISWLWRNVVIPVFTGIGRTIKDSVRLITGIIDGLSRFLRTVVGPTFQWLWNRVVRPVFAGIGNTIASVWRNVISPAFNAVKTGVSRVADAFRDGVGKIKRFWEGLKNAVTTPVRFVVDTIYNSGIRGFWNKVADKVGLPQLDALKVKGINASRGVVVPGYAPGVDIVNATLSPGEGVLVPEAVRGLARAMGTSAENAIQAINSNFSSRVRPPSRTASPMTRAAGRFDLGGIFNGIGSGIGFVARQIGTGARAAGGFVRDKIGDAAEALANVARGALAGPLRAAGAPIHALINRVLPTSPYFMNLMRRGGNKLVDDVIAKIIGRDSEQNGATHAMGGGTPITGYRPGAGVARWAPLVLQALKMMGQPASLLQTVLRRMNQESGGNPNAINNWDINAKNGDPSRGLMQTIMGTFRAYHYPGTSWNIYDPLANILASMRYALARYGSLASAYNRPGGYSLGGVVQQVMPHVLNGAARLFDSGGILRPGTTLAMNATGKDEYILTNQQWNSVSTLAAAAASDRATFHEPTAAERLQGAKIDINVQPQPGTDAREVAREVAVELGWLLR